LDLFWYDGSLKPPTPGELEAEGPELAAEGMMLVGDQGKILAGFHGEEPQVIRGQQTEGGSQRADAKGRGEALALWVAACKGGPPTAGDFLLAGPISDAFNLGAVSLRLGGRRLLFDAAHRKVTNVREANPCLGREHRPGWELAAAGA